MDTFEKWNELLLMYQYKDETLRENCSKLQNIMVFIKLMITRVYYISYGHASHVPKFFFFWWNLAQELSLLAFSRSSSKSRENEFHISS